MSRALYVLLSIVGKNRRRSRSLKKRMRDMEAVIQDNIRCLLRRAILKEAAVVKRTSDEFGLACLHISIAGEVCPTLPHCLGAHAKQNSKNMEI